MRSELIVKVRTDRPAAQSQTRFDAPRAFPTSAPLLLGLHDLLVARGLTARPFRRRTTSFQFALAPPNPGQSLPFRRLDAYLMIGATSAPLEPLRAALAILPEVDAAFVVPAPDVMRSVVVAPVAAPPPATPDFRSRQGYLDPVPGGIGAASAWAEAGGRGEGVSIIDIEGDWIVDHESLLGRTSATLSLPADPGADWQGTHDGFLQHGTSVLGVLGGNGVGVSGIASASLIGTVSHAHADVAGQSLGAAGAIVRATDLLKAGDVMLLEMHMPGPRYGFAPRDDQLGYIAVEWWEPIYEAIKDATDKGIIVVEAAGNGRESLDDSIYDTGDNFSSSWHNPFRRESDPSRDSGAILVGAGAPPSGMFGQDRSRLDFSNSGTALDAQGWGREVTSAGYGDLQGGGDQKRWYTSTFAGTSSASPMVAGSIACVQGVLRAKGLPLLTSASARKLLRDTGSAQIPAAAVDRIGNRPDLDRMITLAVAEAQAVA